MNKEYAGLGGFVWWVGVVEDRNDPLKLGRCRVRIFGWHSESIADCPTKSLPWAQAMMPLNNANTYTPKESDMVVGFFTDGENAQQPVMMGILPGIPLATPNPQQGFNDTRDGKQLFVAPVKPEDDKTSYPRKLDEPTTSQLARYDEEPFQISNLKENLERLERQPSYNAKYPYNNAMESESGHAIEVDDTPQYERIHIYHRMGSNQEYRPDGSVQQKIVKDSTRNIGGDDLNYIKGNSLFLIDGDLTYVVKGKINFISEKDINGAAEGSIGFSAKDSFSASAGFTASVSGTLSSSLGGASLLTSVSGAKTSVSGIASVSASSLGYAEFGASGATTINGSVINLLAAPASSPDAGESAADAGAAAGTGVPATGPAATSAVENSTKIAGEALDDIRIPPQTSVESITSGKIDFGNFNKDYWQTSASAAEIAKFEPSVAGKFLTDASESLTRNANQFYTKAVDKISSLPTDLSKSVGIPGWQKSYNEFQKAAFVTANDPSSFTAAKNLATKGLDLVGSTAEVAGKLSNINVAGESFKEYLGDVCIVKDIANTGKIMRNKLIAKRDEFVDSYKKYRDANRELLTNATREFKNSLKELDDKSLQEWIDSHAYDSSCAVCANQAATDLSNKMPTDQVRSLLTECLYRQADAFINTNKSTIPITGSKIISKETDICGRSDINVNI